MAHGFGHSGEEGRKLKVLLLVGPASHKDDAWA